MGLNTLDRDTIARELAQMRERMKKVEAMLQGAPISNAKIRNLTWDKAVGGTAKLGGSANGNGVLEVYDDTDDLKVTVDKDGIYIRDGVIVIENDDAIATIDSKGLVSTANFTAGESQAAFTGSVLETITSPTTYADITGATLSFTLDRDASVLIVADAMLNIVFSSASSIWIRGFLGLDVNGSIVEQAVQEARKGTALGADDFYGEPNTIYSQSLHFYDEFAAGTHDIALQWKFAEVSGSGADFALWSYRLTYIILGK